MLNRRRRKARYAVHSLRQLVWRNANARREGTAREKYNNSQFFSRQENLYSVSFISVQPWYSRRWVGFCVDPAKKGEKKKKYIYLFSDIARSEEKNLIRLSDFGCCFFRKRRRNKSVKYTIREKCENLMR